MLSDDEIARVMRELTLLDRPFRRTFWLARGFERIDRKPGRLLGYWRRRLETDAHMDYVARALLRRWRDNPPPAPPALPAMAGSLIRAGARFVKSGLQTVSFETLAAREAECRACPQWDATGFGGTGRCLVCGCSTWAKQRMASESCPRGKWAHVDRQGDGK